jgi:hypothetical protein
LQNQASTTAFVTSATLPSRFSHAQALTHSPFSNTLQASVEMRIGTLDTAVFDEALRVRIVHDTIGIVEDTGLRRQATYSRLFVAPTPGVWRMTVDYYYFHATDPNVAPAIVLSETTVTSVAATPSGPVPTISGPTELWYFHNYSVTSGLSESIQLRASSATGCNWSVSRGGNLVQLSPIGCSVSVRSRGRSSSFRDVEVIVSVDGVSSRSHSLTVRAPHRLGYLGESDRATAGGYLTIASYSIQDQFGQLLDGPIAIGESFTGGSVNDWAGVVNWPSPSAGSDMTRDSVIQDFMLIAGSTLVPPPVSASAPGAAARVRHLGQELWVGTPSLIFQRHTQQWYLGFARHEARLPFSY